MSRRDWWLFVADMQEAITKIALYVDAMTFVDFRGIAARWMLLCTTCW
jgi:uncharacterized protein with HEPN domain